MLRLGDQAPDFTAESTEGKIQFHQWLGDKWGIFFSHPRDVTPVCTTELGYVARLKPEFEKRTVKAIGLSVDLVARLIGADLSKPLGQQVVIDNRTGASGMIGTELAKNAAPDGYTLLVNTLPFVTNQFVYSKLPYDPLTDFVPISIVSSVDSLLIVHPSLPVNSGHYMNSV